MRNTIIASEGFYSNPDEVVSYALSLRFHEPYGPQGRWLASPYLPADKCPFKSEAMINSLEEIIGEQIDRDHWNAPYPSTEDGKLFPDWEKVHPRSCRWNASFHVKMGGTGDGVHNHVTDSWNSVGEDGWAALVYLNKEAPVEAGLRLWKPKDPARKYDWMTPVENWTLVDHLGNCFNRILLCRGSQPHSGAKGWGNSIRTGRLFQTFFFKVKAPKKQASVRLPVG